MMDFTCNFKQLTSPIYLSLFVLWLPVTTAAHHSFSAEFDVGRPVEITGTVTHIEWTNPHAWVHLEVVDDEGNTVQWAVELLGINALIRSGMTPRNVKSGDVLTVKGFGARNGTNTANASLVTRTETGERLWGSAREDRD